MIALLLSLAMAAAQPVRAPVEPILATHVSGNQRVIILAFAAYGQDEDLRVLERAAAALPAPNRRITDDARGRLEVMVTLMGLPRAEALQLYRDTVAGRYGRLDVEAIVIRVVDAQDGIDVENEVVATPAANIHED